jgi:hypothetical protein
MMIQESADRVKAGEGWWSGMVLERPGAEEDWLGSGEAGCRRGRMLKRLGSVLERPGAGEARC